MSERFLSVEGLAERWGVDRRAIYRLRWTREAPPAIRIGRQLRFALADVEKWEADRREEAGR